MTKIEKDGVTVEFVDVTPELATQWLEANTRNRNMRYRTVGSYAADFSTEDWDLNGETIKFAADGTLLDGQHRLQAIADSGATSTQIVVRGLDLEAQSTIDRGIMRRFSDILKLNGEANHTALGAIVRAVCIWEAGYRKPTSLFTPSVKQLQHTLDKYPELRDSVTRSMSIGGKTGLMPSIVGLAIHVLYRIEPKDADYFFDRLTTGAGLEQGNPIYELRKRASEARTNRGKANAYLLTAYMFKAWNAFREGRELRPLVFRTGGSAPEQFPEPV